MEENKKVNNVPENGIGSPNGERTVSDTKRAVPPAYATRRAAPEIPSQAQAAPQRPVQHRPAPVQPQPQQTAHPNQPQARPEQAAHPSQPRPMAPAGQRPVAGTPSRTAIPKDMPLNRTVRSAAPRPMGDRAAAPPPRPVRANPVQRPGMAPDHPAQIQRSAPVADGTIIAQGPRPTAQSKAPQSQRPAQQASQGEAKRPVPVTPVVPGQKGAWPSPRPAAASASQSANVTPTPGSDQNQTPASAPAYKQRRTPTDSEIIPGAGETVVASPAEPAAIPVEEAAPIPSPAQQKQSSNKKNDKSKNTKAGADMVVGIVKAVIYMVVVLVVSVFISIFVIRIGNDIFAFVKSDEAVDITIPKNADVEEIAQILHENGVISFPGVFEFYASLKKDNGPFEPGTYSISPSMSYDDLRRAFKKQPVVGTVWITIPEGYTTDEIIDLLVENGIGKRKNYIDVINNYDFDYWFVKELEEHGINEHRAYRLDGYLFPDTYEFYKSSSEATVINRMLKRFNEVFVTAYRERAAELNLSVDDILILASLVEKEAGNLSDFIHVSAVFHNRLKNPIKIHPAGLCYLQSDATTVYGIQIRDGKRPEADVTMDDNHDKSNYYSTYEYEGLPPGPISCPSASAIRAALYPAIKRLDPAAFPNLDVDPNEREISYYFVTDKTGKVYFAETEEGHNANREEANKINESLAG
ncbi:MAG: endolytic transglycosylase MltG [Clostridia bacterium]|nr:endolytic transglycosylase MltG [Clostridia bacterium]